MDRFTAVVEAAQKGTPQTVTKHGVPAVVIISAKEYEKLHHLQSLQLTGFNDHLLHYRDRILPIDIPIARR
ncbi:MAG: type II toxin-antitoxin system prevent-host-death family antitoxin [Magnetococcales bacterium]|nr:type II toxin-antitoxin system prevent-host-death family antitoxin [Magnetococcales bacterium]